MKGEPHKFSTEHGHYSGDISLLCCTISGAALPDVWALVNIYGILLRLGDEKAAGGTLGGKTQWWAQYQPFAGVISVSHRQRSC